MPETIGFVGLGLMGRPMARNLARAGHRLRICSRSRRSAEAAAVEGAKVCDTPAEAAEGASFIITMVGDVPDLQQVLWGKDGVLKSIASGSVLLQMSTVAPGQVRQAAEECARRGAELLDAPVTGGRIGAEEGRLTVMVGGDAGTLDRARPVLAPLARTIIHVGGIGAATVVKLAINVIQAGMVELLGEALVLARRSGVRPEPLLSVLEASAGGSPLLKLKGAALAAADYEPQFALKWMDKDLRLAGEEAKATGAALPVATAVAAFYSAARSRGHGEEDYAAVVRLIEDLNDVKIKG